jgi:phenylacetate-CoA ligase
MITAKWYSGLAAFRSREILRKMGETQFWPRERIRQHQFDKLKRLMHHAFKNVPYYRDVFKGIGAAPDDFRDFEDFRKIPILTKEIIRTNFDRLKAQNLILNDFIANSTGGSTGEPLRFFQDRQYEDWAGAARIRGWYEIAGCKMGDTCAVLWGAMHDVKEDYPHWERIRSLFQFGEIPLNAFNLSPSRKRAFLKWCHWLRPKILRGYVTAIKDLATFLQEEKLSFPPLKGIILCAETVDQDQQSYIESVFHAPSFNTYGGRELSLIAMECSHKNGLHEISENNYVEFKPIGLSGYEKAGSLVITNLNNYAMPFIRYEIGDLGIPSSKESCPCGRGLPLIAKVIGRTTDVFIFPDGTRSAGEMFIHLMKDFPVMEYQFIQTSPSRIVLRLKRSDFLQTIYHQKIKPFYQRYLPEGVTLELEEVDEFRKTATGKFRFVFRDFPDATPQRKLAGT